MGNILFNIMRRNGVVPLLFLLALGALITWFDSNFLTANSLHYTLLDAAPLLMLVLGSTLVILTGAIDLSVGAMASLASVLLAKLLPEYGSAAAVMVIGIAAVVGALQGFVSAKAQVPSFVVSLGVLGACAGVSLFISGAASEAIDLSIPLLAFLGDTSLGLPNSIVVVIATALVFGGVMHTTGLGRSLYAVGSSELAATLSGVSSLALRIFVFASSAACAATCGLLMVAQTGYSSPTLADNLLLPTIVGVVVGGTAIAGGSGGLIPSLLGGLIAISVRVLTVVMGVSPAVQDVVFGIGVIVAVAATSSRSVTGVVK